MSQKILISGQFGQVSRELQQRLGHLGGLAKRELGAARPDADDEIGHSQS